MISMLGDTDHAESNNGYAKSKEGNRKNGKYCRSGDKSLEASNRSENPNLSSVGREGARADPGAAFTARLPGPGIKSRLQFEYADVVFIMLRCVFIDKYIENKRERERDHHCCDSMHGR
mmetsp:Transcript_19241/g.46206  ORF Transcript_19241/g.46206 Transcript_19241/m.46206 type:complete len:119 (-) Transcript_19241:83-439(-)